MGLSRNAASLIHERRPRPELAYGPAMPLRQLRRAILTAPEVIVQCLADGQHVCMVRVTKRAALDVIDTLKRRGIKTVAADYVFGSLVLG
jgi:hypothetical protein